MNLKKQNPKIFFGNPKYFWKMWTIKAKHNGRCLPVSSAGHILDIFNRFKQGSVSFWIILLNKWLTLKYLHTTDTSKKW